MTARNGAGKPRPLHHMTTFSTTGARSVRPVTSMLRMLGRYGRSLGISSRHAAKTTAGGNGMRESALSSTARLTYHGCGLAAPRHEASESEATIMRHAAQRRRREASTRPRRESPGSSEASERAKNDVQPKSSNFMAIFSRM